MSLFSFGQGITLKELLENPKLQNPPQINRDENKTSKKVDDLTDGIDLSSAFLGPNLWGSQNMGNGNNNDFNLEYMDLDEFLCENGIPIGFDDGSNSSIQENKNSKSISPPPQENLHISAGLVSDPLLPQKVSPILRNPSPVTTMSPHSPEQNTTSPQSNEETRAKGDHSTAGSHSPVIEYTVPDTDLALASIPGQGNFDPCRRKFSEEELKPQPIIKKSRKVYVPEDCKDDKYWCRRKKNNVAAKRSRDARRIKENQIAMRAAFLEQENSVLREELKKVKDENKHLKASLKKYET